jgi:hypothetical protein
MRVGSCDLPLYHDEQADFLTDEPGGCFRQTVPRCAVRRVDRSRWCLRRYCLLVVKRVDRVEVGSLASWIVAEEYSDRR